MKKVSHSLFLALLVCLTSCNKDELDVVNKVTAEDLDDDGLPKLAFSSKQPEVTNIQEYIIDLEQWNIPNNGTDPVTTTANLQAAIDWAYDEGFGMVTLPKGEYLVGKDVNEIYQGGIEIHNNTEFVFSEGAVLEMDTNDKWNYCIISLDGDNIIVRDGTIKGDRDSHIFTPRESDGATSHDEGHGICVWNDSNIVLIDNMVIKDTTGDGSLV